MRRLAGALLILLAGCTCGQQTTLPDTTSDPCRGEACAPDLSLPRPDQPMCALDGWRCQQGSLQHCEDGLNWRTVRDCPCGCVDGAVGPQCRTSSCQPNSERCQDAAVQRCQSDGCGWIITERCDSGCSESAVSCRSCLPDAQRCLDAATLTRCDAAGEHWVSSTCDHGCETQLDQCRLCQPGARRCSGDQRDTCAANGLAWLSDPCPEGCLDGECRPPAELHPPTRIAAGRESTCLIDSQTYALHCAGRRGTLRRVGDSDARWLTLPKHDPQCAIRLDGSLWCWTQSWDSDAPISPEPIDPGPFTTLSSDESSVCAVRSGGGIVCFTYGQLGDVTLVPIGPADAQWLAVAHGDREICAIAADPGSSVGELHCWARSNTVGFALKSDVATVIALGLGSYRWRDVSINGALRCAVRDSGKLVCWGSLSGSSLSLPSDGGWWRISVGLLHLCALHSDGHAACLGRNSAGQLGTANASLSATTLQRVAQPSGTSSTRWLTISAGIGHSCGMLADGSSWCWGDNGAGQLGAAPVADQSTPVLSSSESTQQLAANATLACRITTAGALQCWGHLAGSGALHYPMPTQIGGMQWQQVSIGAQHLCAIDTAQRLYCWGSNDKGQLGVGVKGSSREPLAVGTALWVRVAAGERHSCGIQTDGSLWCWGSSLPLDLLVGSNLSPVRIGTASDWRELASSEQDCAIKQDGSLWCWGVNVLGQLGLGHTAYTLSPTRVGTASWRSVVLNPVRSCGITTNGELFCWGLHAQTRKDAVISLVGSLGPITTSALITSDSGSRISTFATTPQLVKLSGVDALVLGSSHSCARLTDGRLSCWGDDTQLPGKLGSGLEQFSWQTVSAGADFTCAVDTAGVARCWGANTLCQFGVGRCQRYPLPAPFPIQP